jgi:integrase
MLTLNSPSAVSLPEAAKHACKRKRGPKKKVQGVDGLRLGCKPFKTAARLYLEATKGSVKESTLKSRGKNLNYIGNVLEGLRVEQKVTTTDPRHMTERDILALRGWMMEENYDPGTQKKMLSELKGMLEHYDNFVFNRIKQKGYKMPRQTDKPIRTFSTNDLNAIMESTEGLANEWHGKMMRGAMALYWSTMRRPSEIRECRRKDLDLEKLTLHIEYPKGVGSWSGPTDVMIVRDDMVPYIKQYLTDREQFLKRLGIKSDALFPTPFGKVYSMTVFNRIKCRLEKESGVRFKIKDFRSSSASEALHVDPKLLPVVSAQLGHKDSATTQKYYARIEAGSAGIELRKALNNGPKSTISEKCPSSPAVSAKIPVIPKKNDITGYA